MERPGGGEVGRAPGAGGVGEGKGGGLKGSWAPRGARAGGQHPPASLMGGQTQRRGGLTSRGAAVDGAGGGVSGTFFFFFFLRGLPIEMQIATPGPEGTAAFHRNANGKARRPFTSPGPRGRSGGCCRR